MAAVCGLLASVTGGTVLGGCGDSNAQGDGGSSEGGTNACGTDLAMLDIPDAPIGDGGATVVSCADCLMTNCGSQLGACNTDCACNATVIWTIACFADGGYKFGECEAPLTPGDNENDPRTTDLYACLQQCNAACGGPKS